MEDFDQYSETSKLSLINASSLYFSTGYSTREQSLYPIMNKNNETIRIICNFHLKLNLFQKININIFPKVNYLHNF